MINDIFRSFFRTLGRILAYIFIGGVIAYFASVFMPSKVNAAKLTDFKLWEGNTAHSWTTGNAGYYIGTSAYRAIQFSSDVLTLAQSVEYKYGFISYCSYDSIYQSFYANSNTGYGLTLYNLQMIDTGAKQKVYGSGTVECTVKYITFSPNWDCGSGSANACTLFSNTMITFYGTASDYQLLNYGLSSEPIIIDSSSGKIVSQNDTIISQNNTLITKQDETNSKLNETNEAINKEDSDTSSSSCGVICKLKGIFTGIIELPGKLITLLIDALKSLFIPENTDFITNFVDSIENKLGFIAEVPISIIEFTLNLAKASWEEVTSISFPSISIFGYNFWEATEVDITEGINIFKPFKYITDCLCVIICARTLNKWRENFTGGGS